ncbi:hypothetical protein CI102_10922 [Trichoderma harzianum]|nr:hypothetical protein CI102_10922 [Trichoderma harzianum]
MAPGCLDPWPCGLLLWHASHAFRLRSCLLYVHPFLLHDSVSQSLAFGHLALCCKTWCSVYSVRIASCWDELALFFGVHGHSLALLAHPLRYDSCSALFCPTLSLLFLFSFLVFQTSRLVYSHCLFRLILF